MTDIVVDTSAVVAILGNEPTAQELIDVIDSSDRRLVSAATLVELGIVMEARLGAAGGSIVDRFIRDGEITVVAVDRHHADRAIEGWRRFGKGRHAAALNLGDCFTYALAAETGLPILCTGNDFARTDLEVIPAP